MRTFKNLKAGVIESVNNEQIAEMMAAHPEVYEEIKPVKKTAKVEPKAEVEAKPKAGTKK